MASKTLALVRYQSGDRKNVNSINQQHETEVGKEKLEAHPELVSAASSVHAINSEIGRSDPKEEDTDMLAGIRHDLVCQGPTMARERSSWLLRPDGTLDTNDEDNYSKPFATPSA